MWVLLGILFFGLSLAVKVPDGGTVTKVVHEPEAECQFSVHKDGPNGEELSGTTLNTQLYYKIKCKPAKGFCLNVSNCTVSGEGPGQKPYAVIDENGCTTEPSLFEHVLYEDDYTAGIYNPLPIRFRGSSSGVQFFCSTTLTPRMGGTCSRKLCTWNEYTTQQP
uniref:ZP domain-containing protein n=1 Tax=Steinernema glaseri TaxID=37863 RepID=A0A1I7Z5G2_9BILA